MTIHETDPSELAMTILRQFAGGPGPPENNLVRFGLPIAMWTILLMIAWSRQRTQGFPRERWLVWAFGLGLTRELFMFGRTIQRMSDSSSVEGTFLHPLEHALTMTTVVVVAGAFLRYVLDAPSLARRYLQAGSIAIVVGMSIVFYSWPRRLAVSPQVHFHQTWEAWVFHAPTSVLILLAVYFLIKRPGWLSRVVSTALLFFFMGEFLFLVNFATRAAHNVYFCPIANSFHMLAIPLLGYVYLREQSIEKRQSEEKLTTYRVHLEDLVEERTTELQSVNAQLTLLHQASIKLASTLEIDQVNQIIAQQSCRLLGGEKACVLNWEKEEQILTLAASQGLDNDMQETVRMLAISSECSPGPLILSRPIVVSAPQHDAPDLDKWRQALDAKSLLYLPIWESEFTTTLLIATNSTAGKKWRDDELSTIESFSNHASAALENGYLHQQLEWATALEERQRIAANIHDGLAQTLSLIGLKLDQFINTFASQSNNGKEAEIAGIRTAVEQASLEARRSIASLHQPPAPRQPLQELLSELMSRIIQVDTPAAQIHFESPEPLYLNAEAASRLLPIVQEMLVNALHHSGSEHIALSLKYDDRLGSILVEDDGCGFDLDRLHTDNSGHFGLTIMRARAAQLNGQIKVESAPGRGTRVYLQWPMGNGHRQAGPARKPILQSAQRLQTEPWRKRNGQVSRATSR